MVVDSGTGDEGGVERGEARFGGCDDCGGPRGRRTRDGIFETAD